MTDRLLFSFLLSLLLFLTSTAAPAPLPKRTIATVAPRPPVLSLMVWSGIRYRTEFGSDGSYKATQTEGTTAWVGFWHVERPEGVWMLKVKEQNTGGETWLEWAAPLADMMGIGGKSQSGVEVRLEAWTGPPDS